MNRAARELFLAVLAGAGVWLGYGFAQRLTDPYSEPRLTLDSLLERAKGGGTP